MTRTLKPILVTTSLLALFVLPIAGTASARTSQNEAVALQPRVGFLATGAIWVPLSKKFASRAVAEAAGVSLSGRISIGRLEGGVRTGLLYADRQPFMAEIQGTESFKRSHIHGSGAIALGATVAEDDELRVVVEGFAGQIFARVSYFGDEGSTLHEPWQRVPQYGATGSLIIAPGARCSLYSGLDVALSPFLYEGETRLGIHSMLRVGVAL